MVSTLNFLSLSFVIFHPMGDSEGLDEDRTRVTDQLTVKKQGISLIRLHSQNQVKVIDLEDVQLSSEPPSSPPPQSSSSPHSSSPPQSSSSPHSSLAAAEKCLVFMGKRVGPRIVEP